MRSLPFLFVCCLASIGCTPSRTTPELTCNSDADCPADGLHRCDVVKHQCLVCDGTCAAQSDTSSPADSSADVDLAQDGTGAQDVGIAQDVGSAQDVSATGG